MFEEPAFSVVDGRTIHDLIFQDLDGCFDAVAHAYVAHAEGLTVNPNSVFLRFPGRPGDRIIALPAHLDAPWNVSGIKWIASYPENINRGLRRASAVLLLNDDQSGYPYACLEGSVISAARTAASAVLAARLLCPAPRRAESIGFVGTGVIARQIYRFLLASGWTIPEVVLYDSNAAASGIFRDRVCQPERHSSIRLVTELNSLLTRCDLICFATTSGSPHVTDPAALEHRPVILHISLRDLAPELLLRSWNVVDDVEHVMHANTSPHLAEQIAGSRDFVTANLADVIMGRWKADHSRAIVFSPFGLGVLDLAVGKWVYERAVAARRHHPIKGFFPEAEQ